jgi:proteasome beta subunit
VTHRVTPPQGPAAHGAGLPSAFLQVGTSSFTDFAEAVAPNVLPGARTGTAGAAAADLVPHGTTIVAATFPGGVVVAGDRRATMGNMIAQRDIEKVFITDSYSAVGIAGAAGIAVQMVRLYTVELEHYEKMEGVPLSLDGKTNKLASMVASNLGAALQGFVVVPLFVGYDVDAEPSKAGRIVTYDATGGRYDEWSGYHSVGSGSVFAKSSLKKLHRPDADLPTTIRNAVEALYDAADDDTATGGPDLTRGIYPVVVSITGAEGAVRHLDEEIEVVVREVVAARTENPGG